VSARAQTRAECSSGEELGLLEYGDIPDTDRQDPEFHRTQGFEVSRDGCRVPLPWEAEGKNFGLGSGAKPHLPQADWFQRYSIEAEDTDPEGTLNMYRQALHLRKQLQTTEELDLRLRRREWSTSDDLMDGTSCLTPIKHLSAYRPAR
jgi:glycosidase